MSDDEKLVTIIVNKNCVSIPILNESKEKMGEIELIAPIQSISVSNSVSELGECIRYDLNLDSDGDIRGYIISILKDHAETLVIKAKCKKNNTFQNIKLFSIIIFHDPHTLSLLGPDGLTSGDIKKSSYLFIAGGQPKSKFYFTTGWISQKSGSGILFSENSNNKLKICPFLEYGINKALEETELFGISFGHSISSLLESYAEILKNYYQITLPPILKAGYCTWYAAHHSCAADEWSMENLASFANEKRLLDYGFEILQIDDMWQAGPNRKFSRKKPSITLNKRTLTDDGPRSDFTTHKRFGPYPHGMKAIAEKFVKYGFTPGIWFMPFAWDPLSKPLKSHHDWFVKKQNTNGKIYQVKWAGWCLDMSHPEAQSFLQAVVRRITQEWGYRYLKMDGLWSGMAVKIRYPHRIYEQDELGDAIFFDKTLSNVEVYRKGLQLIRDAASPDTFLLGCNVAQNFRTLGASMGLVDAMRIGRDIGAKWAAIVPCMEMSSRLYFLHGKVWYNDPDCLMLRKPLTINQARAWASWVSLTGQLNIVSEWLPRLPKERLDIFLRSIPNTGHVAIPLDLLENDPAQVWHLISPENDSCPRRDIIGVFNIDDSESIEKNIDFDDLGLPESYTQEIIGYDFWNQKFIDPLKDQLHLNVPPSACVVVALRPLQDYPEIISTSRHISQGVIDIQKEIWDRENKILYISSELMPQDPYIVSIFTGNYCLKTISIFNEMDVKISEEEDDLHLIVKLLVQKKTKLNWAIKFR